MKIPRWLPTISCLFVGAWAVGIFILSSLSGEQIAEINYFEFWDKAGHFCAFAGGAVLLALALRLTTSWPAPRLLLVTALAISAFGATDEWHQLYTPNRSGADFGDWVADSLGALGGAFAFTYCHARSSRKTRPAPQGA